MLREQVLDFPGQWLKSFLMQGAGQGSKNPLAPEHLSLCAQLASLHCKYDPIQPSE